MCDHNLPIDLLPNVAKYCMIDCKGLGSPCYFYFTYPQGREALSVYLSLKHKYPDQEAHQIQALRPIKMAITPQGAVKKESKCGGCIFTQDAIYVGLESTNAMRVKITVTFKLPVILPPKQTAQAQALAAEMTSTLPQFKIEENVVDLLSQNERSVLCWNEI